MNDTIVSYFSNLVGVTPSFLIVIIGFSLAAFIVVNVMALMVVLELMRKERFLRTFK